MLSEKSERLNKCLSGVTEGRQFFFFEFKAALRTGLAGSLATASSSNNFKYVHITHQTLSLAEVFIILTLNGHTHFLSCPLLPHNAGRRVRTTRALLLAPSFLLVGGA